jgi:hypothetical protein
MLKTFDLVNKTSSSLGIFIFLTMSIIFIILTFIILKFNWNFITKFIKKSNRIFILFKISLIMQICLSILLVLLNSQIIFLHYYSINILMISLLGSYSLSFFILFFLTYKFLRWFSIKKNYGMLFYSLAFGTIFLASLSKLGFTEFMMMLKPQIIFPMTIGSSIYIPVGSIQGVLNDLFLILSILSFVFSWIASAIMLKEYSNKLGQLKYWIIVSIPLFFYIAQFFVLTNSQIIFQLTSNLTSLSITLTTIFIFSNLIGGLLFGIPFWTIAKTIDNSAIKTSMTIAGFGFVFIFLTNQAHGIVVTPYPPYGIITSLYFGLSSFLLMVGFYCSAIYMSENQDIRRLIKKDLLKYDLLSQMSNRFIEDRTINYINQITKSTKHELFTNYNELFLKDEDIKHYVKSVINEISRNEEDDNSKNKKNEV